MTDSNWTSKGATLSHNNACKEFGISEESIIEAMKEGTLQYRVNYAHGNRYYRVLREEVEAYATKAFGRSSSIVQKTEHRLKKINTEIRSLKRKITVLENEKIELQQNSKA